MYQVHLLPQRLIRFVKIEDVEMVGVTSTSIWNHIIPFIAKYYSLPTTNMRKLRVALLEKFYNTRSMF